MRKMILLALTLMVLSAASVNAQVRIGGIDDPHKAAVLDLNASNDEVPESNSGGFYLPRISLNDVKQKLNGEDPLNGAVVWNTNDDFYLGKGVYVWGDSIWVPIQRTPFNNSNLQPIAANPFVTVFSNPVEGLGVTFQVPAAYTDMGNTARFLWKVEMSDEVNEDNDDDENYTPTEKYSVSGSRHEVLFVPYDDTKRKYKVQAQAIPNNGSSNSKFFSEWVESAAGKYQGWYRIAGPTGFDIFATQYNDSLSGRDSERTKFKLDTKTPYTYTVEALGGTSTADYQWSIERDETGGLVTLGTDKTSATVELIFNEDILSKNTLVSNPTVADTIVLQCNIIDDMKNAYTLTRKITVGDRDECSPKAGLLDAEGNRYTISRFDSVCWMTQNLRSTYTWQGTQKQELKEDINKNSDNNAVSYYYPGGVTKIEDNPTEYGLLYTWGATNIGTATTEATNAFPNKTSDRQGICPEGWAIPSDYDWNQLEKEIATHPDLYSSQKTSHPWAVMYEGMSGWRPGAGNTEPTWWGRSMKSPTTVGTTTDTYGVSKTDGLGFNALLVGNLAGGNVYYYNSVVYFWSGSAGSATVAWRQHLGNNSSGVHRDTSSKYSLLSVRCKKI